MAMLKSFRGVAMAGHLHRKALRGSLVAALLSLVAACASGARPDAPRLPVVTDPAPIVSGITIWACRSITLAPARAGFFMAGCLLELPPGYRRCELSPATIKVN